MILTKQNISDFCANKNSTLGAYGYTYNKEGTIYSTDIALSFTCKSTKRYTKEFPKSSVESWLISTELMPRYNPEFNLTENISNIFCMQSDGILQNVNNNTVTCYRDNVEEERFSGQDVAKWIIKQQLNGD